METSWLALRLAGNSRKEVTELRERYLAQAVEGDEEWARARRASDEARLAAWRTVKDSPHAQTLGATTAAPPLDELPQALAAMRDRISQTAQHMDTRDQATLGRLARGIRTATAAAAEWRGHAALAVTEQQRRQLVADQHPDVHRAESLARRIAADTQQRRAATAVRYEAPAAVQPPPPKGPAGRSEAEDESCRQTSCPARGCARTCCPVAAGGSAVLRAPAQVAATRCEPASSWPAPGAHRATPPHGPEPAAS
ncbi:hypothetical protein [Streptomyces sp. NPDC094049]|uniref:hypothetical protein n=1 Tax=Streptomyces sp. NPDC094049 TaxID=3154987 RepID=UPI00331C2FC0